MNKFELHCHSNYSVGGKIPVESTSKPKDIIRTAKKIGLSGIAITDHDKNDSWKEAKEEAKRQGIIFIQGIEISAFGDNKGHILGLGLNTYIEPGLGIDETIDRIHEQGGIAISAHPYDTRNFGTRDIKKSDAIEVFNAIAVDRISNIATEKQARKLGKSMTAGSDAHTLDMIGTAITKSNSSTMDEFLKNIKKGKIEIEKGYVSASSIVNWSWERLMNSRKAVLGKISYYSMPKKQIARYMLGKFIRHPKNMSWIILADIALGASVIYSGIRNARAVLL